MRLSRQASTPLRGPHGLYVVICFSLGHLLIVFSVATLALLLCGVR